MGVCDFLTFFPEPTCRSDAPTDLHAKWLKWRGFTHRCDFFGVKIETFWNPRPTDPQIRQLHLVISMLERCLDHCIALTPSTVMYSFFFDKVTAQSLVASFFLEHSVFLADTAVCTKQCNYCRICRLWSIKILNFYFCNASGNWFQ